MSVKGSKTRIEFGDQSTWGASTTWTPFAKVIEVGQGMSVEAEDIDTSHMESPDEFEEFDPGWANAGEVQFKIQFEKAHNEVVYGLFRQKKGFRMILPDAPIPSGSKWKFNGYIKGFANETDRIAAGAPKMGAAFDDIEDKSKDLKKVADTLADLQKQATQFGLSDSQKKIADLSALGATPEQIAQAKQLLALQGDFTKLDKIDRQVGHPGAASVPIGRKWPCKAERYRSAS